MSSLYASYFAAVSNGVAAEPLGAETVTTSGTSAQTTKTKGIIAFLAGDAAHWCAMGTDPTATADNGFYVPTTGIWVRLKPGQKLAAITLA